MERNCIRAEEDSWGVQSKASKIADCCLHHKRHTCQSQTAQHAYIVSQVHPEVQVVARANVISIEVAEAPVRAAVQEELQTLHALSGWWWQPGFSKHLRLSFC